METEEMRVFRDGNCWCFVLPDFEDLQNSPVVFSDPGDTDMDAIYEQLINQEFDKDLHDRMWHD
jgi:hypothetical protein